MEGMLTENASSKFFYICLPHIVFLCQKLVLLTKVISTEGNVHAVLKSVSYRSLGKIELLFHWEKSIAVVQLCLTLSEPRAVALQAPLPMGFSSKNTGVCCHFFLQGIFWTKRPNSHLLHWQVDSLPRSHLGSLRKIYRTHLNLRTALIIKISIDCRSGKGAGEK